MTARYLPYLRVGAAVLSVGSIALGVFTIRTMNDTRHWVVAASNGLIDYSLAERALQVDLLNARAGLLRNYDPVNEDIASERENLSDLARLPMRPQARHALARLSDKVEEQGGLVEQFKSDNALLQNSLTRFTANGSAEIATHNVLSARILKLTLDTSPQTVADARAALDRIPAAREGSPTAQLTSHARLLVTILPEIDELLHAIRAMRMESRSAELETMLREESRGRSMLVSRLQAALATTVLLLTAIVIALVSFQRTRTRELKAQAANERLSAAIATPLIDSGDETFASRVRDAVHQLALHIGAKRLQLVIPAAPDVFRFSWPDDRSDASWLETMINAADADGAWFGDKVVASRGSDRLDTALTKAMTDAGIHDLVLLRTADPFRVVIGFEPADRTMAQRRDHVAGVISAIIVIAHGARREVMQIERDRLERTLARARRMETIGTMASGVAHNFNNIICAIGGFAEMGQEHTRHGSSARYNFDEIQEAVLRARDLVDDILNFARQRRPNKRPIDISEVLTHTVRLLSASARDSGAFQLRVVDGQLSVLGACSDLQQVLLNVCNNASHVSGGLPVIISSRRIRLTEERRMSHSTLTPGSFVVISIADSGRGVAEAARGRLVEPFFTTKAGGTGLGLSTAWEIVQDHGGTIHVENQAEGGACFSIWLPEIGRSHSPSVIATGSRILLIAEPDHLAHEEEQLAELGYEPLGFTLSAAPDQLRGVLADCDALLIVSQQPAAAVELVQAIGSALGPRPLLMAIPEDSTAVTLPAIILPYPPRPMDVSQALSSPGRADWAHGAMLSAATPMI